MKRSSSSVGKVPVVIVCYADHSSATTFIYRIPAEKVTVEERRALARFNNTAPWEQEDRDEKDQRITSYLLSLDSVMMWTNNKVPDVIRWARKQQGAPQVSGADEEEEQDEDAVPDTVPWKYLHDMLTEGKWAEHELPRDAGAELFKSGDKLKGFYHIIKSVV